MNTAVTDSLARDKIKVPKHPKWPPLADAAKELAALEAFGGRLTVWGDPAYPPLLAQIHDPPPASSFSMVIFL